MPSPSSEAAKPVVRFRLRITAGDVIAIGPGKIALLEAIAETGSITAAAKRLDMSYRRAWMLLDELNHALRRPAVDSAKGGQHGGGSALTETGRQLIVLYRGVEAKAEIACRDEIGQLRRLMGKAPPVTVAGEAASTTPEAQHPIARRGRRNDG